MRATDLVGFTALALIVGVVIGWRIGYRRGKLKGAAQGDARCRDNEQRLKELQSQIKQLLGVPE